jgi:hypothetical protein
MQKKKYCAREEKCSIFKLFISFSLKDMAMKNNSSERTIGTAL